MTLPGFGGASTWISGLWRSMAIVLVDNTLEQALMIELDGDSVSSSMPLQ